MPLIFPYDEIAKVKSIYGGNMTAGELAVKFGWVSVIVSTLANPILMWWSNMLAFPIWLPQSWGTNKLKLFSMSVFSYYEEPNVFRRKVYHSPKNAASYATGWNGWNCHVDSEGGKFYESFFGVLHCLECKDHGSHLHITPNPKFSWLPVTVFVEFCQRKGNCYGHRVRFFFPLDGPNKYNPFTWITVAFVGLALFWFSNCAFKDFKIEHDVDVNNPTPLDEKSEDDKKGDDDEKPNHEHPMYVEFKLPSRLQNSVNIVIQERRDSKRLNILERIFFKIRSFFSDVSKASQTESPATASSTDSAATASPDSPTKSSPMAPLIESEEIVENVMECFNEIVSKDTDSTTTDSAASTDADSTDADSADSDPADAMQDPVA